MTPPEFCRDSIDAGERFHREVGIVDLEGRIPMQAAPVDFVMRHVGTHRALPGTLPVRAGRR